MKVYIQTDIEGVAGVTFFENRTDNTPRAYEHGQRMRVLLTGEVNAAVRGAFDSGATEVLVNDNHGTGYNILFEDLDPRCEIIHGRNCSGPAWMPELDDSFDALVLVGHHAMANTPGALLQHSRWEINGGKLFLSEASMAAALAGDLGVPSVFVSGDNLLVAEVSEKVTGIQAAVVKKALSPYQARSRTPAMAREMIYRGVTEGLKQRQQIKPFKIPGPVTLNLIESLKGNHDQTRGYYRVSETGLTAETLTEAFNRFLRQLPWNNFDTKLPDGFKFP
jgi:D-amino peptidase